MGIPDVSADFDDKLTTHTKTNQIFFTGMNDSSFEFAPAVKASNNGVR